MQSGVGDRVELRVEIHVEMRSALTIDFGPWSGRNSRWARAVLDHLNQARRIPTPFHSRTVLRMILSSKQGSRSHDVTMT